MVVAVIVVFVILIVCELVIACVLIVTVLLVVVVVFLSFTRRKESLRCAFELHFVNGSPTVIPAR